RAARRRLLGRGARNTPDGSSGALRVERDGVALAALAYTIDARSNTHRPDAVVPDRRLPTIQAAIDAATDRNHDGVIVVGVRAGLYREHLAITRALELVGRGADLTLIAGDSTAAVVTAAAPGVLVNGIGAIGGSAGFNLSGSAARLHASSAWHNFGAGVIVSGANVQLWDSAALENGADGVQIGGGAALCAGTPLRRHFRAPPTARA